MKKLIFIISLIMTISCTSAIGEENVYPLDFKVRVYPQEIRYGDPCFIIFSVTNRGQEIFYVPYGSTFLYLMKGQFSCGKETLQHISNLYDFDNEPKATRSVVYSSPRLPVKPGETMDFHIRMVWFPPPELAQCGEGTKLLQHVNLGKDDFIVSFAHALRSAYGMLHRPILADGLTANELEAKGYKAIEASKLDRPIRILPRPQEELYLLQEWYLCLPVTATGECRWLKHVFAHPYHAKDSPFKIEASTPEWLRRKREPFRKDYDDFFSSIETRTPESLARIKRTNELAAQILERAKQPNSTISQNMVEFIQLRSFLVDMRYAENLEAEKVAFDNLVKFVESAKDKELWLKFLDEIALDSIVNYTHFKPEKVQHYRKQFAEHFAEDFKKIGWTVRP